MTMPREFKVPSRRTLTRDCLGLYCEKKDDLAKFFKENNVRVSLTTDTWTSIQNISYMSVTAHYIDQNWELQKRILSFVPVDSHKGDELGIVLETCLMEWGIEKVFSATLDNASANDGVVKALNSYLNKKGTNILGGKYVHMRCAAHITNLIVADGLKVYNKSVAMCRACCKWVRQSPQRIKAFKKHAVFEGIEFKKNVIIDVPHRWNSCFRMLATAEKYEVAFDRHLRQDKTFKDDLQAGPGVPEASDWATVRNLAEILSNFYWLTKKVSGSWYCTSNLFLPEIIEVDSLMKYWKTSPESDPGLVAMATNMLEKFNKYWGNPKTMNQNLLFSVVLDPSRKFSYLQFAMKELYGSKGLEYANDVKIQMRDLYDFYKNSLVLEKGRKQIAAPSTNARKKSKVCHSDLSSGVSTASGKKGNQNDPFKVPPPRGRNLNQKWLDNEVHASCEQSELDTYLGEVVEMVKEGEQNFDVLQWWKLHEPRFPILAAMARDVLAVPISTVASESAFSTGGRVLDDFRSSLTPKMAQALICAQDWLRPEIEKELSDEEATTVAEIADEEDFDELFELEQEFRDIHPSINMDY